MEQGVRTGLRALFTQQGKTLFLLLATWIAFALYIRVPREGDQELLRIAENGGSLQAANLHLLVPASKADPNLCKVMVSAAITGYPAPVIINWEQEFDELDLVQRGSHLAKIQGVHDYLDRVPSVQDDDLVLMVDGYDTWLQLRPQTLIERYFDINRRANARIAASMGKKAMEKNGTKQEIIFGAQKGCWPWTADDPPCYAVPQSSLPGDIYGPQTDTDIGDEANPYIKFRPRFLNSGMAMGTVKAMRKLFKQALDQMPRERGIGSDQYIFSHIFGDQEVWRETVRRESNFLSLSKIEWNEQHISEVLDKAASHPSSTFEFGIGLDYASEMGLNTVFAEDDTAWVRFDDTHTLSQTLLKPTQLAPDIQNSPPPFWTFNHDPLIPRWTSWSNVSLFTNIYTGIVPAIIHHNAHRDGRKALRETWWPEIWFGNFTRVMYDAAIYEPIVPIGSSQVSKRDYWGIDRRKGGAMDVGGEWLRFDDMCGDYSEDIFRDGKGRWLMPETH